MRVNVIITPVENFLLYYTWTFKNEKGYQAYLQNDMHETHTVADKPHIYIHINNKT